MRNRAKHIFLTLLLMTGIGTTAWAQVVAEPQSPIQIRGNVYGGGEMAKVDGSTNVTINTGQLAGSIFGGGEGALNNDGTVKASADISGNTTVTINGGEIVYTVGDENNLRNIYGGGNLACNVAGNTNVTMTKGIITTYSFVSDSRAMAAWRYFYDNSMKPNQPKTPICSVFGAGYGAHTDVAGNTNVNINIPGTADIHPADGVAFTHAELEAIDRLALRLKPDTKLSAQFVPSVFGGGFDGTVGAYDPDANAGAGGINYDKTTYTSQANITIEGQPFVFNVFGGGLGSKSGADANGGVNSHVGSVYGATKVDIQGGLYNGDVFGGGAGIESETEISSPFGGGTVMMPYTYAAQVMRETDVTISGNTTVIFGNVYGGGDIANTGWYVAGARPTMDGHVAQLNNSKAKLDYTTSLNLNGGNVLGSVFGGGNGRTKAQMTMSMFVGTICGSTNVSLNGTKVWSHVYGGGNMGVVFTCQTIAASKGESGRAMATGVIDGCTNVAILNGMVAKDIFGGGFGDDPDTGDANVTSADIYGNAYVYFERADLEFSKYWKPRTFLPSDATNEQMLAEVTGQFLDQSSAGPNRNTESDITHNLYGGGNMACDVKGNTHVYMVGAPTAPDGFRNSDYYKECIANVAKPHFSVFGGGFGNKAKVTGSAYSDINLGYGTGLHSIIGGGLNGTVGGKCQVHVGNDPMSLVHFVYGGGYYAPCAGTELEITRGTILENVFGGAVMGDINAAGAATDIATKTVIGLKAAGAGSSVVLKDEFGNTLRTYTYAQHQNQITIGGDVYGGNDVSGTVNGIAKLDIFGGTINGDVFGAGNGDHIGYYTPGLCRYDVGENDNYYVVDHSGETSTDGKGTVGPKGDTYKGRPQTIGGVELTLAGNTTDEKVSILGQVFGGGNSCTVGAWETNLSSKYAGDPHKWRDDPDYFLGGGKVDVTLGSHVKIGRSHKELVDAEDEEYLNKDGENVSGLYMGCSGRHLATQETDAENNSYHHYYDRVTAKYWPGFAVYQDDGTTPLSRAAGLQSYNAYLNNILVWSDNVTLTIDDEAEDIWLANFVGGGFRGSMKAKTAAGRFAYTLPEGVTVGNAIVGGAYNTDVVYRIFETSDGHTYTTEGGHYKYLTNASGLQQVDDEHPNGDYHHIEYAEDGETISGIVRFYYDGGMLSHDNSDGRIHQVHADPRANAAEYTTAYFEPLTSGPNQETSATKAKLFTANKNKAFLHLDLRCALEPEVLSNKVKAVEHSIHGGNVFGGCYMSGLVQGDSWIDYGAWLSPKCANSTDPEMQHYFDKTNNMQVYEEAADLVNNNALNVFGAGFGENTHTAGDTYLYVKAVAQVAGGDGDKTGKYPYMFNAFGGSYAGRVYGNTNVYYASGKQGTLLGSLYGGGFLGDIDGNTFVELAEGFVTNVYGGSRQANIGGAAHVWAYDGKFRGIDNANHLIICNLYGGNDIAGEIRGTMSAPFTATRWPALSGKNFNTYVEVSSDDGSANRGFPLIGSAYAGGNGENWDAELGTAPNVGKALIEMDGGSTLRAFGGGNMATVTDSTYIFTDAHSTNFAKVKFTGYQHNIMQNKFFAGVPTGYTWTGDSLTMDPYHVVSLYGGNNVAEMTIQPQWNLLSGKLGSVYAGGNLGNMTYYNAGGSAATKGAINPTPMGLSIHVESDSIEINELYGGCRLADVVAIDAEGDTIAMEANFYGATVNVSGGRIHNVYGGNDIAGHVYNGANVNICGAISGDVYGSGNGNYIYQYDASKDAPAGGDIAVRVKGDLNSGGYVYYAFHGDNKSATETEKIQAINAIRPNVDKAYLNIAGSEDNLVYVTGNVYCGGNASTVSGENAYTKFDIGSYCVLNGVFMGSNGELMAVENNIAHLREINGIALNTATNLKEYMNAVAMAAMPLDFTIAEDITEAYIGTFCLGGNRGSMTTDQPVHMTIPSSVTIFNKVVGACNNAYLSTGGTSTTGGFITYNTDKTLPKITLDIYAKFLPRVMYVPEFQDANAKTENVEQFNNRFNNYKAQKFLYVPLTSPGTAGTRKFSGKFCNVYGGCYTRGVVYGDVVINMYSDMLGEFLKADGAAMLYDAKKKAYQCTEEIKEEILTNTIKYNETSARPVFSIFGGGYGSSTVIYGNTHIRLLNNRNVIGGASSAPHRDAPDPAPLVHPSVNAIYGGGEAGKMVGTSTIHIADGTVYSNVVGGALAGNIYGNTEILVGYPGYWEVQKTGQYKLKRSNFTTEELGKLAGDGDPAVRQSIFLTKGDRINAAIYQAINDYGDSKQTAALERVENKVSKNWDDIEINIKGGIYGGGYSRANVDDGQTAMTNTVLKFTSSYNLATSHPEYWTKDATLSGTAIGKSGEYVYGGNATIWVQDEINASNWKDGSEHITISTETDPVAHTGVGGIFGDGHSSLVAAFRSAAVEGYGYAEHPANAPKLLNTFQRFDILQIRDCSMKMYGDIDVATGQNDPTNYAVSRITELMLNSHINDNENLKATNQLNARNVIDFYNPVHFLGSITSEVTFKPGADGSRYHDKDGRVVMDSSYYDYKNRMIAQNYDYDAKGIYSEDGCKEAFGARNVGTAKNVIRIDDPEGRGVHLKVVQENNYAYNTQGVKEEQSFYGPLSGVFQFELTNVNARGGGYVYSNNLHQQTIDQSEATHATSGRNKESFLQTSGNVFFVPVHIASINKDRQVYDDCYPIPYSDHGTGELDKAHYWFVEGDGPTWCSYPQKPETVDSLNQIITIETAEQLAWVYDYIDHGYDAAKKGVDTTYSAEHDQYPLNFAGWTLQLGNDIDLGQLTILDQREVPMIWCPIADQKGTAFQGTFDGNGHKIDGMLLDVDFITTKNTYGTGIKGKNYSNDYDHYFGLFAKTEDATIKNVELSNAKVINYHGNENELVHIGTFITQVNGTKVQDCSVQQADTITSNMTNEVQAVAAFICHTAGAASTIERNFVSGSIYVHQDSTHMTAPMSGFISTLGHGSTMEHCYSLVDVTARSVAGLADTVKGATLEHSYYAGKLTRKDAGTEWGAILANADNATVKHCYYDATKNPDAKGYQGSDATVFSNKATKYTSWSTFGLTTQELSGAKDHDVWRSCYSHGHNAEEEAEAYRCHLDADDAMLDGQESAWNKGIWTYINGFYPFLKSQGIDCSALTTAFVMPTAESLHMTTKKGIGEQGWLNIDTTFSLPTYGHMYWTVNNNTLLLDSISQKAQSKVGAHLYLGGPDALTLNCDEYVRWMQEIYVTRQDINSPADAEWYAGLRSNVRTMYGAQLHTDSLTLGMLRNKEVTNISRDKEDGKYVEHGFDGDLHIWNREGSAGSVTNQHAYTVNGTITYYTGYTNPYLWQEVNVPFAVANTTVYRRGSKTEYDITARNAELAEDADGGNFWLRSFGDGAEILYGGSTFQQAWQDPAIGEQIGHRPSTLRFPLVMKVDGTNYQSGDYWCYAQENNIDGVDYNNGGSEIRFYSAAAQTVYGTQDWSGNEDSRGAGSGYSFIVYGNPTLSNIQLEGYYWILETEKRDTAGINDPKVKPEFGTNVAQWFSLQQDPVIKPLGIWLDGPNDFKEKALGQGSDAPLRISGMHEPGVSEQFGQKEASFTASGRDGHLGVFSYIDQIINIYDVNGHLTFTTPVRANTGFTVNLPSTLFLVQGSNSPKQVKVLL